MLEKLSEEGTPKSDYSVEVVDSIDLSDTHDVRSLRGDNAMEIAQHMIEDAGEAGRVLSDGDNYYWVGSKFKEDISRVRDKGEWFDLGSTLDAIAGNLSKYSSFERLNEEHEIRFKLSDEGSYILIVCILDV